MIFYSILLCASAFTPLPKKFIKSHKLSMFDESKTESMSELMREIKSKKIDNLYIQNDLQKIYIQENDETDYKIVISNPILTKRVMEKAEDNNINAFIMQTPTSIIGDTLGGIVTVFNTFLMPIFFITIFFSLFRGVSQNRFMNNGMFQNNFFTKNIKEEMSKANISLSSWAGSDEIFQEVTEVVSYVKNATLYEAAGAEIPKGILLEGPPGTGKTLLAKAIASECDAHFISIASSEFVEVYVGLGASKVRDLFKKARDNSPCILFIDEIDSIGKQRGTGINLGNDEREQTLNQLLAEMDGFTQNNDILVIAATNRKDVLDSALLRPGRFDRIINVPLPDKRSRVKILESYGKNKQLDDDVNNELLGEFTNGFSGAQLKNLMNEAAIYAARSGSTIITQQNFVDALEKLVIGIIRHDDERNENTIRRVSIHEMGHAFIASYFYEYFELKKVSIQSTYNGAGGYTLFNEDPEIIDGGLYTKDLLKKRLMIAMGGKACETLYYGKEHVSLGAVQDLKQANSIAQSMIGNYGMGDELMVFYNEDTESGRNPFLGRSIAMGAKYSDKTKELFDKEVLQLLRTSFDDALELLSANKDKIDELVLLLIEKRIIGEEEIQPFIEKKCDITIK